MTRNYLTIMATLASTKSIFSTSGNIITKSRNRLAKNTFKAIICIKSWKKIQDEETDSDIELEIDNE